MIKQLLTLIFMANTSLATDSSLISQLESIDLSKARKVDSLSYYSPQEFKTLMDHALQSPEKRKQLKELNYKKLASWARIGSNTFCNLDYLKEILIKILGQESLDMKQYDSDSGIEQIDANDLIDQDYKNFFETHFGDKPLIQEVDIHEYFENRLQYFFNKEKVDFLPGKYADLESSVWHQELSNKLFDINKKAQGWKIHISAMPHSARKIGKLVLNVVKGAKFPSQQDDRITYKIIRSIPHMRTLYAFQHVKGLETQPGKFFVIYSETPQHAYELVKALDEAILEKKYTGDLVDDDFLPLIGDAIVGNSNQVYVRYGAYQNPKIKMVDQSDVSMVISKDQYFQQFFGKFVNDDPFYPWPDFMNKHNATWSLVPNPFKDLPLKWVKDGNKITWETRPNTWLNLATSDIETSRILEDIEQDNLLRGAEKEPFNN